MGYLELGIRLITTTSMLVNGGIGARSLTKEGRFPISPSEQGLKCPTVTVENQVLVQGRNAESITLLPFIREYPQDCSPLITTVVRDSTGQAFTVLTLYSKNAPNTYPSQHVCSLPDSLDMPVNLRDQCYKFMQGFDITIVGRDGVGHLVHLDASGNQMILPVDPLDTDKILWEGGGSLTVSDIKNRLSSSFDKNVTILPPYEYLLNQDPRLLDSTGFLPTLTPEATATQPPAPTFTASPTQPPELLIQEAYNLTPRELLPTTSITLKVVNPTVALRCIGGVQCGYLEAELTNPGSINHPKIDEHIRLLYQQQSWWSKVVRAWENFLGTGHTIPDPETEKITLESGAKLTLISDPTGYNLIATDGTSLYLLKTEPRNLNLTANNETGQPNPSVSTNLQDYLAQQKERVLEDQVIRVVPRAYLETLRTGANAHTKQGQEALLQAIAKIDPTIGGFRLSDTGEMIPLTIPTGVTMRVGKDLILKDGVYYFVCDLTLSEGRYSRTIPGFTDPALAEAFAQALTPPGHIESGLQATILVPVDQGAVRPFKPKVTFTITVSPSPAPTITPTPSSSGRTHPHNYSSKPKSKYNPWGIREQNRALKVENRTRLN